MSDTQGLDRTCTQAPIRVAAQTGLALLGILLSGLATGQDSSWKVHPALQDTWSFQLGGYLPKVDTTASLNSASGARGTSVGLEDDLGFDDRKTTGTFLGSVRLGERWRIEAEYLSLSRSSSRAINRTIAWGERTFPINTVVSAEFDSDVYRLSGGYSFVKNDRSELGVSLGLHVTDFTVSLAAAGVGGQTGDGLAPLPTIGLYGAYAFSPRWLLFGRLDYFSLKYGDYDGSLVNFTFGVDYRFTRNFGIGASYRHVDYDLDVTRSSYNGSLRYKFNGPTVYAIVSF